ncbi:hypothetical protein M011DRAFT_460295 [Sporormia fimetaria CBS 119925]|uniref:AAR2 domain-containing protein n=1 Tax=Sporormia fimetaria CBS 119925 TaxID=1340428 RepID=A0A6A6V3D5_9PLEO|nr:hypothetical protein M011DRAFT_460295 [Sporormia fimetaria CBS 119925]
MQTHCVLLLDLPSSALAGIDLLSFTTTPRFRGVKNLPPGLHFVFASSDAAVSVRYGAWFYVSPGTGSPQIFIKKWDPAVEDLVAEKSQEQVLRWKANLGSLWKENLTPYRQSVPSSDTGEKDNAVEESTDWADLTSRINASLLSRICGLNPDHWSLSSASSAPQDLENIPGLESSNTLYTEKELNLLPIDLKRTWRIGATGRERTEAAQDRSWTLGDLIDNHCKAEDTRTAEEEVLGELQFCFLMVLTLNNNSCLEQWKRLLGVLLTCQRAVQPRAHLFVELLKILRMQLSHCADMEAGMFDMHDQGGGFLQPLLRKFRKTLDELEGAWTKRLVAAFEDVAEFVKDQYGWELDDSYVKHGVLELEDGERVELDVKGADEDDETGEYAPAVVDLTPEQAQRLYASNIPQIKFTEDQEEEEERDRDDMDTRY